MSSTVASLSMQFSATTPPRAEKDSSNTDSLSPPIDILYAKEDKDTLAYEHDRARHMKTLDRARTKARKAFAWGNASQSKTHQRDGSHGRGKSPRPPVALVEDSASLRTKGGKDEEGRELAGEYQPVGVKSGTPKQNQEFVWSTGASPFSEVRLADLVVLAAGTTGGQRKKRGGHAAGKGGLDGDFEIIPHVRSVIVLEDGVGLNGELDEGWECVQAEEDEKKGVKSYARVAAAALEGK